jgi:hypothetical protein
LQPLATGHYWVQARIDLSTGLLHTDVFNKPLHESGPLVHSACLAPGWSTPDLNKFITKSVPALGITGDITLNELSIEDGIPV